MKNQILSALAIFSTFFLFSCGGEKPNTENEKPEEKKFVLDDLLDIKDEAELKQKFGTDHVTWDTVWGGEGEFTMGSYLDKGTANEVQFLWEDDATRGEATSVAVNAMHIDNPADIFSSKWETSTGIKLGMTTDELEKKNGKSFIFSGFGWDYGGGVNDWREGNLDKAGIGIQLMEGPEASQLPQSEYLQVLGDQDVSSDHPVIKKLQPRVTVITVFKPE
jgi:hypothetical protein